MPATPRSQPLPAPAELRARFDAVGSFTVGIEEEVMLLDPLTLDLAPVAAEVLGRLGGDPRFKPELPAAQIEIATTPAAGAVEAIAQLAAARADLLAALDGTGSPPIAWPAAAAVHPFAAPTGPLSDGPRYDAIRAVYGPLAARQLVASLQVHVAVGGGARTLAVHDALRGFLPELAALAANGAFHDGADTGFASARPGICALLPRQGVPPVLGSLERFAAAAARLADPHLWWWELRPHPTFGTLELRVPDAQTTLAEAAGVVVVAQALVAWLAERWDAGDLDPTEAAPPSWRIEENRFAALRRGVEGELADLRTGERRPARERLHGLLDQLAPVAERLGAGALLPCARALVERNGAIRQREVAEVRGLHGLAAWQAERFGDPPPAAVALPSSALAAAADRVPARP